MKIKLQYVHTVLLVADNYVLEKVHSLTIMFGSTQRGEYGLESNVISHIM